MTQGFFIDYIKGFGILSLKVFILVFGIVLILEILRESGILDRILHRFHFITKPLGLIEESGLSLLAGFLFGIIYGAGVMLDSMKEKHLDKHQVFLVCLFLGMCHGIIEDTFLFLLIGANGFWIVVPRILLALPVTFIANKLFKKWNLSKEKMIDSKFTQQ